MTRTLVFLPALAILASSPVLMEAQVTVTPTISYHEEFDWGFGAQGSMAFDDIFPNLLATAEVAVFFPDLDAPDGIDVTYAEVNLGARLPFPSSGPITPFVAAGLHFARISVDGGELGTVAADGDGVFLGGGLAFDVGGVVPEIGGRFEIGGGEGFAISLGVGIPIG